MQGSKFYENELKKEQQVNQRIEKMMLQKAQITEQQLKKAQAQVSHCQMSLAFFLSKTLKCCLNMNITVNSSLFL